MNTENIIESIGLSPDHNQRKNKGLKDYLTDSKRLKLAVKVILTNHQVMLKVALVLY